MRSIPAITATLLSLAAIPAGAQTLSPPPGSLGTVPTTAPAGAAPDMAQATAPERMLPLSNTPANITPGDTASVIAPPLPMPPVSADAPTRDFLMAARQALAAGRTGEAQEALERAESRALTRDVRPSLAGQPSEQPDVVLIGQARSALGAGDKAQTLTLIDQALKAGADAAAR
ncbi:hypothetical protein [Limobrevibacterium gyesilva]|uniref:Uncharacterized protein n=1 Tax=Limobrevibacterium gyesilva TaxID=2991712 RepID=A0AA42CDN3_9PROT|nr:hypothetical protein [Limobrevibacterium gyesilva]MCW3474124.1 hypothetical protein [Limobrevibacterium gyesilva]